MKTDQPVRIYETQVRKKAHITLKEPSQSVEIKITGDSINLKLIAPENARLKVKGRKRTKRQHAGNE